MGLKFCWKKSKEKNQISSESSDMIAAENKPNSDAYIFFLKQLDIPESSHESAEDLIDYIKFSIRVLIKNIQSEYTAGYIALQRPFNMYCFVPFYNASAFWEERKIVDDFLLEGKNVVSFTCEHRKMFKAFKNIKQFGFQPEMRNKDVDGLYFPELELALIQNGQHHIAATWEDAYKGVKARVEIISLEKALDVVKISEDCKSWEYDDEKFPIEDFRFAMIFELYRKQRELEKKAKDDVATT